LAIKDYNHKCIKEFNERKQLLTVINTSRIHFFSSNLIRLLNEIPIFFSDLRKMQDRFLNILAVVLNLKELPPKSMNKAIKNSLEKYQIPPGVCELIYKYWENTGKLVKDYRDIDQHWHQIVQRTWLQLEPEKKIIVILPDSKESLTYDKEIDALEFMEESFNEFHEMVEKIYENLGYDTNNKFPILIPMNPPIFIIDGMDKSLLCLIAFDEGPISGVELYVKENETSIFTRLLPRSL